MKEWITFHISPEPPEDAEIGDAWIPLYEELHVYRWSGTRWES